jgi:cell cycle arrest protein BUB2
VQGMNVLAAPFLYAARSEAEAFVAFHRFLTRECPGYVRGAMDGVHRGLAVCTPSTNPQPLPLPRIPPQN